MKLPSQDAMAYIMDLHGAILQQLWGITVGWHLKAACLISVQNFDTVRV